MDAVGQFPAASGASPAGVCLAAGCAGVSACGAAQWDHKAGFRSTHVKEMRPTIGQSQSFTKRLVAGTLPMVAGIGAWQQVAAADTIQWTNGDGSQPAAHAALPAQAEKWPPAPPPAPPVSISGLRG